MLYKENFQQKNIYTNFMNEDFLIINENARKEKIKIFVRVLCSSASHFSLIRYRKIIQNDHFYSTYISQGSGQIAAEGVSSTCHENDLIYVYSFVNRIIYI